MPLPQLTGYDYLDKCSLTGAGTTLPAFLSGFVLPIWHPARADARAYIVAGV